MLHSILSRSLNSWTKPISNSRGAQTRSAPPYKWKLKTISERSENGRRPWVQMIRSAGHSNESRRESEGVGQVNRSGRHPAACKSTVGQRKNLLPISPFRGFKRGERRGERIQTGWPLPQGASHYTKDEKQQIAYASSHRPCKMRQEISQRLRFKLNCWSTTIVNGPASRAAAPFVPD